MVTLRIAVILLCAVVATGCSTITPSNIKFEVVDNAAREKSVNRSLSSVAPMSGTTMYIFKRNFGKDEPLLRAQECLRYVQKAAPTVWGEAFGEASAQSVWELARESVVREINNGNFSQEFILSVVVRAVFDGGRSGFERAKNKIISLESSCFNTGGGGTGSGSDNWMPNVVGDAPNE